MSHNKLSECVPFSTAENPEVITRDETREIGGRFRHSMLALRSCCRVLKTPRHARSWLRFLSTIPTLTRTHHCAELSAKDVGKRVVLSGWLMSERYAAYSASRA